jgi:hypothetical protein
MPEGRRMRFNNGMYRSVFVREREGSIALGGSTTLRELITLENSIAFRGCVAFRDCISFTDSISFEDSIASTESPASRGSIGYIDPIATGDWNFSNGIEWRYENEQYLENITCEAVVADG